MECLTSILSHSSTTRFRLDYFVNIIRFSKTLSLFFLYLPVIFCYFNVMWKIIYVYLLASQFPNLSIIRSRLGQSRRIINFRFKFHQQHGILPCFSANTIVNNALEVAYILSGCFFYVEIACEVSGFKSYCTGVYVVVFPFPSYVFCCQWVTCQLNIRKYLIFLCLNFLFFKYFHLLVAY